MHTLLPIIKVKCRHGNGEATVIANVLFDCGSERSYVTESFVQRVQPHFVGTDSVQYATFGGKKAAQTDVKNLYQLDVIGANNRVFDYSRSANNLYTNEMYTCTCLKAILL